MVIFIIKFTLMLRGYGVRRSLVVTFAAIRLQGPRFTPRGGDLGETGGRSSQNLRWGNGPYICPPNILRSSGVGCAQKCEQSFKKGVIKEFFSEIAVFLVRKR